MKKLPIILFILFAIFVMFQIDLINENIKDYKELNQQLIDSIERSKEIRKLTNESMEATYIIMNKYEFASSSTMGKINENVHINSLFLSLKSAYDDCLYMVKEPGWSGIIIKKNTKSVILGDNGEHFAFSCNDLIKSYYK